MVPLMERRKGGKKKGEGRGEDRRGAETRGERERETKASKRGRKSMAQRDRIVAELEDKNKKNGGRGQRSRAKTTLRSRVGGLQQGWGKVCAPGWGILVKDGADTDSGRLGKGWQVW